MLLEPLMSRTKKNNDERQDYATSFFMSKSKCKKEPNKYYRRKCVSFKCQDCKDITPANLICQTAQETVKVSQFELTKVPFTKINKHHNFIQKANNKTDKIEKVMSYKELIQNEKKNIHHTNTKSAMIYTIGQLFLSTTPLTGAIYNMAFSENISQMHKYELQSSH